MTANATSPAFRAEAESAPAQTAEHKHAAALIQQIGRRASKLGIASEFEASIVVSEVHRNVCALRLDDLVKAEDHHFAHDVGGMVRHLDGDSLGGFLPRFRARKAVRS